MKTENGKMTINYHKLIILFVFVIESFVVAHAKAIQPAPVLVPSPAARKGGWPLVTLNVTENLVVMDNGIVRVTIANPEGYVTAVSYAGLDNILEDNYDLSNRGYWDIVWGTQDGDGTTDKIVGNNFTIIKQDPNQAEISFSTLWNPSMHNTVHLDIDIRYIMLQGSSGFYSYGIFEHKQGMDAASVGQLRAVYKLQSDKFHYMAVTDKIQREMPMPQDRVTGRVLAYKEAVLLTHPVNGNLKGEVDDKYQYSLDDKDTKVHGWICDNPAVGFWMITPSNEFRSGGPLKQDLTSHTGAVTLAMFHSNHYAGKDISLNFQAGEPWKKVYGPFLVHLNSVPDNHSVSRTTLWSKAKDQMNEETKRWPYDFPMSSDYPKSHQRGSIVGRLMVRDRLNGTLVPASSAWVGLAAPGTAGSWQVETKGYQFWSEADERGNFRVSEVHGGSYNMYGWVPGYIGDFKFPPLLNITPGEEINMGEIVYEPPRNGPTVWEIGIPDRTVAEFYVPDPSPDLPNRLFLNDSIDKYRQYGLWDRYTDLYPKHDLVYNVGSSNYSRDWFFAQMTRRTRDGKRTATTWQINFELNEIIRDKNYTLQLALASADQAKVVVRVNQLDMTRKPHFMTERIGWDNAIARHGIHGLYRLYSVAIPGAMFRPGNNTIYLTQPKAISPFEGLMYDYIRLESPPRV